MLSVASSVLVLLIGGFLSFGIYHWIVALFGRGHSFLRSSTVQQALLDDDPNPPSVLLLGPSGAGKTELYRRALVLAGIQHPDPEPPLPTRGLVRHPLYLAADADQLPMPAPLPAPGDVRAAGKWRRRRVLLCDAGGGRQERRQWVELVCPPARVGTLVFVADARDATDDTLSLIKQLAHAKWARSATLLVALTKLDLAVAERGSAAAMELCAQREAEFKAVCSHPFSLHVLNGLDDTAAAARLIAEAVQGSSNV